MYTVMFTKEAAGELAAIRNPETQAFLQQVAGMCRPNGVFSHANDGTAALFCKVCHHLRFTHYC